MDDSLGSSFMAVFAVSGSVVFLAMQVHKRLLSNFMKKMEFEIGHASGLQRPLHRAMAFISEWLESRASHDSIVELGSVKDQESKMKVRFADDVVEISSKDRKACPKKHLHKASNRNGGENIDGLPLNWQALYQGILQYRNLKGYT